MVRIAYHLDRAATHFVLGLTECIRTARACAWFVSRCAVRIKQDWHEALSGFVETPEERRH